MGKVDVGHRLYAEDAENTRFAVVVHSMSYDFEGFEEDYEDQKSSFVKAGLEEHWVGFVFYLLFHNKPSRFLSLDYADKTARFQ